MGQKFTRKFKASVFPKYVYIPCCFVHSKKTNTMADRKFNRAARVQSKYCRRLPKLV